MKSAEHQLEGLRAALKRGTHAADLRVVAGVCDKQHTLAEVFRGDDGEMYVITLDRLFADGKWHATRFVERLDLSLTLRGSCRCNGSWTFESKLLTDAIGAKKTRVVVRVST